MLGVAYQPGGQSGYNPGSGIDPLSDASVCLRDAALMQRLGVNSIRVYNVDPDLNHDECASIFNGVCGSLGRYPEVGLILARLVSTCCSM
jgi:hypothetical protein